MEDLEWQTSGCKSDLGTQKPLDNFGHKGNKIRGVCGGRHRKNKDLFLVTGFHDCKQ